MTRLKSLQPFLTFLFCCLGLLIFRTLFGLNNRFWDEDEKHIYLLGLELFSFHQWPYFGADIIHTATQIPGALQSFLVGLPLFLFKVPESPFVFVNLLSLLGLALFAIYLAKHYKRYHPLLILLWLNGLPWTLEYGTHVYNPSYLLLPNFIFFIAFFECIPSMGKKIISFSKAFFLMGFSLGFILQIHLSWPILLPFLLLALILHRPRLAETIKAGSFFIVGMIIPCLLLFPTFYHLGWNSVLKMNSQNSEFNFQNVFYFFNNIVRLLCYASYETFLFIGENTEEKKEFLLKMKALIPFFFILSSVTIFQLLYFPWSYFKMWKSNNTLANKNILLFLFTLITASLIFVLSTRPPVSRNLYLLLPLCLWLMFQTIDYWVGGKIWRMRVFKGLVFIALFYHGLMTYNRFLNYPQDSLYSNRDLVVKSLEERDPYIFEVPRYSKKLHREAGDQGTNQ